MSILVKDLSFSYQSHPVLNDITFQVNTGEIMALLGPNGVGKSTLFRCILGIQTDYSGSIWIHHQEAKRLSAKVLASQIAYIPQMQKTAFHYSVLDMVLMGTTAQLQLFQQPGPLERQRALNALERFRISHLAHRDFDRLSGGECQLTLIARAVAQGAKILLLDEPTASLDYGNTHRVMEEIYHLRREGYTILFSTHDPNQALSYSNTILALHEGEVAAFGNTDQVLKADLMEKLYQISVSFEQIGSLQKKICIPLPRKEVY